MKENSRRAWRAPEADLNSKKTPSVFLSLDWTFSSNSRHHVTPSGSSNGCDRNVDVNGFRLTATFFSKRS